MNSRTTDPSCANWRKSTRSGSGNACIELAALAGVIGIRDSKNPSHGHLALEPEQFAVLVQRIKQSNLDR
jgi:Domain of unknown function (DUF397)